MREVKQRRRVHWVAKFSRLCLSLTSRWATLQRVKCGGHEDREQRTVTEWKSEKEWGRERERERERCRWIGMNKAGRITLSSPTLTYSEPNGDRAFSCHLAKIELRVFRRRTSPPGNELPVLAGMNVFSEFRRLPVTAVLLLLLPSAGLVQGTADSGESPRTVYYCIPTALVAATLFLLSFFLFFFFFVPEINALLCILRGTFQVSMVDSDAFARQVKTKWSRSAIMEKIVWRIQEFCIFRYIFVECTMSMDLLNTLTIY